MENNTITPMPAPAINIPQSKNTCQLSLVDCTAEILNAPDYAFYIKNENSGRQVLFDLGMRTDWQNYVPRIVAAVKKGLPGLEISKDVHDILAEGGVDINGIEAGILSHWHWDHCGNPAALPKSMKLVVGPGFVEAFTPGYPTRQDSPFHEADFEGRQVEEIKFSEELKIGIFKAHDYFQDGSLYLLDVPGHAIGHMCALVRTTPDTFAFLGGDICHHGGVFRPTEYLPMPDPIPKETRFRNKLIHCPCPCASFTSCHPEPEKSRTTPFFKASTSENSWFIDPETAQWSINGLTEFDADANVIVLLAHDLTLREVMPMFPRGVINDWKQNGWKEATHWGYLEELPYNGKIIQKFLTDGQYHLGERLNTTDFYA